MMAVRGKVCLCKRIDGSGYASPRPRSMYGVKVCMSSNTILVIFTCGDAKTTYP